jgi:STE24 endopeptidase
MRRFFIALATGVTLGYTAVRVADARRERANPSTPTPGDARAYGAEKRALMLAGMGRSLASLAMTAFVIAPPLDRMLPERPRALKLGLAIGALTLLGSVAELPADYVEGIALERRYGTATQTDADWLNDRIKSVALGGVFAFGMALAADALVRRLPRTWPLVAIAAAPPLLAVLTVLVPTFVMPLFNKFVPIEGALEERIRALARAYDVGNAQILRVDMSRRTTKANAYVTGVLGTERIVLGDTLIEHFQDDETLFVVAHELGHYVARDAWRGIGVSSGLLAVTILGAHALNRARPILTLADALQFAFYASLITTLLGPVGAAYSRQIEWAADRFALAATNDAASGMAAFARLREQNLAEDEQPAWMETLFTSHPSLKARIAALAATI